MKIIIVSIMIIGISFIAGSIIVGGMLFENTVVENPYETGLLWDKIQKEASVAGPDCDIDNGSCKKKTGAMEIVFDITPKPVKAMKELTFTIALKNSSADADKLTISLEMPGMYMGENKIVARKSATGIYTGRGVITGCRSGKKLWRATIEGPSDLNTGFLFELK